MHHTENEVVRAINRSILAVSSPAEFSRVATGLSCKRHPQGETYTLIGTYALRQNIHCHGHA